jgi:hypothetical protein
LDEATPDGVDPSGRSREVADAVLRLLDYARPTSDAPKLLLPPREN